MTEVTVAGVILWWLGGMFTALAVAGFSRHKGLGVVLLVSGILITFWAWTGTKVSVPIPHVVSPGISPTATVSPAATHK